MYIAIVLAILCTLPLMIVVNAWTLSVLIGWFLVPLGVPALGIVQCAGIMLITGYLTFKYNKTEGIKDVQEAFTQWATTIVARPIAVLALGYVLKMFM